MFTRVIILYIFVKNIQMKVLKINASSNTHSSVTRKHVDQIISQLSKSNDVEVVDRDVALNPPATISPEWLAANWAEEKTAEQEALLKGSDALLAELFDADVLVIGAPMYNFTIPASLKAYFDQIARAGKTFRYTENGPVGLVEGKKAYVVISSGGVPIGSPMDFSKGYLQLFLGFIGISDVEFVVFDQMNSKAEEKTVAGEAVINAI